MYRTYLNTDLKKLNDIYKKIGNLNIAYYFLTCDSHY